MDKFSDFTVEQVDEHYEYLTQTLQSKNINLFFIEFFSSTIPLYKFERCNLLELENYFKKPYSQELKETLFKTFFPSDATKIINFKSYIESMVGYFSNDRFLLEDKFIVCLKKMLQYISEKSNNTKEYSHYISLLVDALSYRDEALDYNIFSNLDFTCLSDKTLIGLIEISTKTEEFYQLIMSKKPHATLIEETNFVHYLLIDGYKAQEIYQFLASHQKLNVLEKKDIILNTIFTCPKLLKLANINLKKEYAIEALFTLDSSTNYKKFMNHIHTFWKEEIFVDILEKKLKDSVSMQNFLEKFVNPKTLSQNHLYFIDYFYSSFVKHTQTCPFQMIGQMFNVEKQKHYYRDKEQDTWNKLYDHMLESEKRVLECQLQSVELVQHGKKLKI